MGADLGWTAAITIAAAGAIAWLVTGAVLRRAATAGLIDAPNYRSSHRIPMPRGGGLGFVVAGVAVGAWLELQRQGPPVLGAISVLSALLAGVGLRDDVRRVPAAVRFACQTCVCALFVRMLGVPPVMHIVLTFWGVWWINLFNFMDGIDGIAAAEAVFILGVAAALAVWRQPAAGLAPIVIWTFSIIAAVLAFLVYNWPPAKIFMGDVGSTWLAFVIFALALLSVAQGSLTFPTWLILAAAFVADTTVTLLRRVVTGQRWFEAHRSHAYQRLARRWGSHRDVVMVALAIDLVWLAPLAALSVVRPELGWPLTGIAYVPLVVSCIALGAGARGDGDHAAI